MKRTVGILLALFLVLASVDAVAKSRPRKAKKKASSKITVPVDLGIGPTANYFYGPLGDDQTFHYGLKFDLAAIIDNALIKKNQNRIPKKYRKQALKMKEFRLYPLWYLPDSVFISPKIDKTAMYGITFRPLHIGLSLLNTGFFQFSLSGGLVLTYAYIQNENWTHGDSMHFLRPGVDTRAEITLQFSKSFLISFGADAYFYIPQPVDQPDKGIWDLGGVDDSIWLNTQAFVMLHFRFPYTTSL